MYYLENICFLCLTPRKNNISYDNRAYIAEKLEYFIPKYLYKQSIVPKHICNNCSENLNNFHKFKENCLKSIAIFNEYFEKLSQDNDIDTYRYLSVQLTDFSNNRKSDKFNVKQNDVQNINKKLKEEITETDNSYKQNQVVEVKQENGNIEQAVIENENVIENYEMKREITSELIIKEERFDDSESTMDAHNQLKNESDKKFESNGCFDTFHNGDKLEIHNHDQVCRNKFEYSHTSIKHRSTNYDKKPHKCDVCKKTYSHKCNLNRHKTIHTGETPFACDVCKKTFRRKDYLIGHKRIHTGERPYTCNVCKKSFNYKRNLNYHKTIHAGAKRYACDVCKKSCRQKIHLIQHKRIHTGERPFACNICNKRFTRNSTLITHKRIHTGEKPFACVRKRKKNI